MLAITKRVFLQFFVRLPVERGEESGQEASFAFPYRLKPGRKSLARGPLCLIVAP